MIPFGDWLPDLPDFENPGATLVKNVIPAGTSYRPFSSQVSQSNALTARCQGAFSGKDNDGNVATFAGDATKLYKISGATWSDVSGSAYTIDALETWQWTQWGEDVIATNIANNMQKFTVGTDAAFSALTTVVKARYIAVVKDFLVIGNTTDNSDGAIPHRVRWAGQGTTTDWTVSAVTQGDYNDLDASKGWVRQIVGGAYGTVFQEKAITRMTYVGSPLVFQLDQVESGIGTNAPNSVIKFGNLIAYLGDDGFYVFDGSSSTNIGANKVNKFFYSDVAVAYKERIYGVNDPINHVLMWCYPGGGNTGGIPNKIISYNYSNGKWGYTETETEILSILMSAGYTLDSMDSYNSSLDAIGFSLDSRFWTGGSTYLAGFNTDHKLTSFTGTALDATLETTEFEVVKGNKTFLHKVRPIIDGGTTTIQVGSRNNLSDSESWGSAISLVRGDATTRNKARYHRIRTTTTGGFNFAQGVDILKAKSAGKR